MKEGYVKFINPRQSYGFITADQRDYFFSLSGFDRTLQAGDKVIFEATMDAKGLRAKSVTIKKIEL